MNSSLVGALYHWSPSFNRVDILQGGIKVFSDSACHSGNWQWPYICLSPHPSQAWSLSVDAVNGGKEDPIEEWDLWQVTLPDNAEVHVREFWGRRIEEFKVYTSIPADHVWFCGMRTDKMVAIKQKRKRKAKAK